MEKRKTFDIAEQRKATDATGKGLEEDPYAKKYSKKKPPKQEPKAQAGKIPKWKLQSMQLRKGLGQVKTQPDNNYGGNQIGGAAEYEEEDDRVLCNYCGRKFNENAASRHIAFCE